MLWVTNQDEFDNRKIFSMSVFVGTLGLSGFSCGEQNQQFFHLKNPLQVLCFGLNS